MNLEFDLSCAAEFTSNSQKIRVLTEDWVVRNIFCPVCGKSSIKQFKNNKPVADFFCEDCKSDFELKSKESNNGHLGTKIVDGAYETMIQRITSLENPNFFFLTYSKNTVTNFFLIPNHFFTTSIIEKRKPLANTAKRAGWVGCNINICSIPESGKIYIVKNKVEIPKEIICNSYKKLKGLQTQNLDSRGWILDVLSCVERLPEHEFSLQDVYNFEQELTDKHPENNFIKDKIRQQLQFLRDKGFIEFIKRGSYRKL
jgi:type II restriction enzyme